MSDIQIKIWEILESLSGEDVARLFTDFYGNQLLTEEFMEFIEEVGYSY